MKTDLVWPIHPCLVCLIVFIIVICCKPETFQTKRDFHRLLESICNRQVLPLCFHALWLEFETAVGQSEDRKLPALLDLSITHQNKSSETCRMFHHITLRKFCWGAVCTLSSLGNYRKHSAGIAFAKYLKNPQRVSSLKRSPLWNIVFQGFNTESLVKLILITR